MDLDYMLQSMQAVLDYGAAPLEFSFLLPESSTRDFALRILGNGVIPILGVLTNALCIVVIVLGKLYKNWTYMMVINLAAADLVQSLNYLIFFLPPVIEHK